jgi:hypothetical protein
MSVPIQQRKALNVVRTDGFLLVCYIRTIIIERGTRILVNLVRNNKEICISIINLEHEWKQAKGKVDPILN